MAKIDYQQIDVEQFLQELGMRNVKKDGQEILFSCPFPGHNHSDANPSASMQIGSTKTYCFGCGWSGNALTFLSDLEQISPLKAARYIREWIGAEFKEPESTFSSEIEEKFRDSDTVEKRVRNQPLDKKELEKRYINWFDYERLQTGYLFNRGFSAETLKIWNIGWDAIDRRFTIPYFDGDDLIGFKGRALDEEVGKDHTRYKVLGGPEYGFDSFDISLLLFGQQILRDWNSWFRNNSLIVREGEFNVLALHQLDIGPAVGISGSFISDAQAHLLKKIGRPVILWFDDEEKAVKSAEKLVYDLPTSIVPTADFDPADTLKFSKEKSTRLLGSLLSNRFNAIMV